MGDVVPFKKREAAGNPDDLQHFMFYYYGESYALIFNDRGSFFAEAEYENGNLRISDIDETLSETLYEKVFPSFFLNTDNISLPEEGTFPCALFVYFDFDGEEFAAHYRQDRLEEGVFYFFKMEKGEALSIRDELKLKRVVEHFQDCYVVSE